MLPNLNRRMDQCLYLRLHNFSHFPTRDISVSVSVHTHLHLRNLFRIDSLRTVNHNRSQVVHNTALDLVVVDIVDLEVNYWPDNCNNMDDASSDNSLLLALRLLAHLLYCFVPVLYYLFCFVLQLAAVIVLMVVLLLKVFVQLE